MHEYYAKNKQKLKKTMNGYLKPVAKEIEDRTGKPYPEVFEKIWALYEQNMLEKFPYIGGDDVSGTGNLTGAYMFVAMGEVMRKYGADMEEVGHTMVLAYERKFEKIPGFVRALIRKVFINPKTFGCDSRDVGLDYIKKYLMGL